MQVRVHTRTRAHKYAETERAINSFASQQAVATVISITATTLHPR